MMSGEPLDDKLFMFRQQASIIARKKEAAAEMLSDTRDELLRAEQELESKQSALQVSGGGEDVVKGEEVRERGVSFA